MVKDTDRQHMRSTLETLLATTLAQRAEDLVEERDMAPAQGEVIDPAERAGSRQSDSIAQALEAQHIREELELEAALHRLAQGSFGRCTDCGERISPQRLQANPQASRCLGCQSRAETPKAA